MIIIQVFSLSLSSKQHIVLFIVFVEETLWCKAYIRPVVQFENLSNKFISIEFK